MDLDINDNFGYAVAAETDTIAVGARGLDDGHYYAGGVYIFDRKNSIWSESLLISDNGGGAGKLDIQLDQSDYFGSSVSLNEDLLAVGAPYDDDGGTSTSTNKGAVYLFEKSGDIWSTKTKISENDGIKDKVSIELDPEDYFGSSMSLYDSTLAVGAYGDDDGGNNNGAVYIFEKDSNDEWVKQFKISENDGDEVGEINIDLDSSDYFGYSVALYDDVLVIGALYDDDGYSNSGAVYIFKKENNTWVNKLKLSAANGLLFSLDAYDYFGSSVGINGNTITVGAYGYDSTYNGSGATYVFELDQDNNITLVNKFSGYDGGGGNIQVSLGSSDYFGYSSSVYIDEKVFTTHPELSLIKPISATGRIINDTTPDLTIQSTEDGILSTEGQCEIITTDKSITPGTDKTITISNIDGNAFSQGIYSNCTIVVTATNKQEDRLLLDTFTVGKPIIVVGAYADDDGFYNAGAVYVYEHNNSGEWEQSLKISDNVGGTGFLDVDLDKSDFFGYAVAAETDTIAVGARGLDDGHSSAGGVYIFDRKIASGQNHY